ncbi:MAG TPA: hypothetical protein VK430_03285 [Xanthobacteraceae bacterium]|nr:hypothetical protein [Xanthobacteraceae bacterium]
MMRRAFVSCAALLLVCIGAPAMAGQCWHSWDASPACPRAVHYAIYELENRIALLEADPAVDDGYKAPIITSARADILRLRATLFPAQWRWTTPCCYSRPPIYIRWASHRRAAHRPR